MNAKTKTVFDKLFEYIEKNIMSDNFKNECNKIIILTKSLWFDELISFVDISMIDRRIFDLRLKRINLKLKSKIENMKYKFKARSEEMKFNKIITERSSIQ